MLVVLFLILDLIAVDAAGLIDLFHGQLCRIDDGKTVLSSAAGHRADRTDLECGVFISRSNDRSAADCKSSDQHDAHKSHVFLHTFHLP